MPPVNHTGFESDEAAGFSWKLAFSWKLGAVAGVQVDVRTAMRRAEPATNPDQLLVERTLEGDRAAFSDLVRRHDDRLRGLASRLLGGDRDRMDDALQDAYVRAFRGLGGFRSNADVGTWLYRIVYNSCIDELRRGRRRPEPVDVTAWDTPSAGPGPERTAADADSVQRVLAALPDDQRVTVVLVDAEGFDNVQAAELLGVAVGTVASRLSRARATMRRVLEADEEDRP